MDSFEVNKILGALLGTCLGVLSINIAAGAIFTPVKPAKPGYEIAVPEQTPAGKPAEPEKQEPIEQLLAKADVGRGENAAKKCERADIIAYLNSLSDNPAPLPKAAEAAGSPKPQ